MLRSATLERQKTRADFSPGGFLESQGQPSRPPIAGLTAYIPDIQRKITGQLYVRGVHNLGTKHEPIQKEGIDGASFADIPL